MGHLRLTWGNLTFQTLAEERLGISTSFMIQLPKMVSYPSALELAPNLFTYSHVVEINHIDSMRDHVLTILYLILLEIHHLFT